MKLFFWGAKVGFFRKTDKKNGKKICGMQLSEGRADCIVETPQYVYIFEFKLDGTAQEALQQIHDRGYSRSYEADPRKKFLVGASFSSQTGTVEEWLVE